MIEVLAEDADRINMVIIGLLVVAALLAVLTFWYWRQTDPRRRVSNAPAAAAPNVDAWLTGETPIAPKETLGSMAPPTEAAMTAAFGEAQPQVNGTKPAISDDEWTRLTGPRSNDG